MPTTNEYIQEIRKTKYIDKVHVKYANCVTLNGYLLTKPFETMFASELSMFWLVQVGEFRCEIYPCQAYAKTVIEELRKIKNVCLVNVLGRLVKNTRNKKVPISVQVEEIAITTEFLNMPLIDMTWGEEK